MSRHLAALIASAGLLLGAASPALASDVSQKASDLWKSIKSYSVEKKSDAVNHGNKLLKDMDAQISRLEARAGAAKGEAKSAYEKEVRELKVARKNAGDKLDHLGKQSGAAWNDAKDGFADAYRDLHHAADKVAAKIK